MINLENLEEVHEEQNYIYIKVSKENGKHLLNFLERNHYLLGYDEQFAKEYLQYYIYEQLNKPEANPLRTRDGLKKS